MANFSKPTLTRIGRMLNSGDASDPAPLLKLAKAGAFGRKAIYNWTLAETDPQHRTMPRLAKRMVATLAYFAAAGLLNDKRLEEIAALEAALESETASNAALRRMKRALSGPKGAVSVGETDEHDLGDDEDDEIGHAVKATPTAPHAI